MDSTRYENQIYRRLPAMKLNWIEVAKEFQSRMKQGYRKGKISHMHSKKNET